MRNDFENAIRRKEKLSLSAEVLLSNADELAEALVFGVGGEKGFLKENILQSDEFPRAYAEARKALCFDLSSSDATPNEMAPFLLSLRNLISKFTSIFIFKINLINII